MPKPIRLLLPATIATGLILGALAGCMTDRNAGPASMADYGLYYSENEDEGAKLAYGLENSDSLSLMLQCPKGSGQIQVFQLYGPARSGPVVLTSAGQRSTLNGKAEISDGPSGGEVQALTTTAAPALTGFRKTGMMEVSGRGYRYRVAAKAGDQSEISRFFTACGAV